MAFRTVIDGIGAITETSPGVFDTTGIIGEDITSLANDTINSGCVVGGMVVSATDPATNQVQISAGKAWVLNDTWSVGGSNQKFFPVNNDDVETVTIPANTSGNPRINLICVKVDPPATPGDDGAPNCEYVVIQGTPASSPVAPAVPALHTVLAQVAVANGFSTIVAGNITDRRVFLKLANILGDGWMSTNESWVYAGADGPTFTVTVAGIDLTTKYYPGMRVRLSQTSGGTKYFIITRVVFSTNTTITLFGGTDYTLVNQTITDPSYSREYAPAGFPTSSAVWRVLVTNNGNHVQASPVQNTWYNLGGTNIVVPIGVWRISYNAPGGVDQAGTGNKNIRATLSTGTSSETDAQLTAINQVNGALSYMELFFSRNKLLTLSSKTTYYLNFATGQAGQNSLYSSRANFGHSVLEAVSAYI